ncbi:MAG: hypothetical protein JWP87_5757 [Labilithrix sp.]|nr:hypothetical protein [Labilithrix sp.]
MVRRDADEGGSAPPRELVIDAASAPGDSSDGAGSAMAPFAMTALASGVLAKFVSLTVALVPLGLAVVFLVVRRKSSEGRFVLRVEDGAVEVRRERGASPPVRIALADLVDVTLDRQTHQGARGASATERVRLALERRDSDAPVFVPEERVTPIEAQEWYGKVRVFLRKHGWVPDDEREAPAVS